MTAVATADRLGMQVIRELRGGYGSSWVALVDCPTHGRCVLKALEPEPQIPGADEAGVTRRWRDAGARLPATLLDEPAPGVLQLEWIDGPLLAERGPITPDEAAELGRAARELHLPAPGGGALLHGDLNARNLIASAGSIRCIDPHGLTGDPAADLIVLAARNPARDRRATFVAACDGYGIEPQFYANRLVAEFRAFAAMICTPQARALHPTDDLLALLHDLDTSPFAARSWLMEAAA